MTAIAAETYEYEVPPQTYGRPIPVPDGTQGNPVGLDHENLLSVSPVVCHKCEQPLSAEIVKAPCLVFTLNLHGPHCRC